MITKNLTSPVEIDLHTAVQLCLQAKTTSEARNRKLAIGALLHQQEKELGNVAFHAWLLSLADRGILSYAGALAALKAFNETQPQPETV